MKIPKFSCEPANEEEWNQLADACEAVGIFSVITRESQIDDFQGVFNIFRVVDSGSGNKYQSVGYPAENHITVPEALKLLRPEEKTFEAFSVDISGETVERLELMESLFGSWVWFDRLTNEEMLSNGFLSFQISGKVFSNSSHYGPEITFNEALYRLGHDFDEGLEVGMKVTVWGGDKPIHGVIREFHDEPWRMLPFVSGWSYERKTRQIKPYAESKEPATKTFREFKVNVEGNPKALEALKDAALTKGYRRIDDHEGRALQFACYEHGVSRAIGVDGSASETLSINEALIYLRGYGLHKYEVGQRFRNAGGALFLIAGYDKSLYRCQYENGCEYPYTEGTLDKLCVMGLSVETPATPKEEEVTHEFKVGDEVLVVASTWKPGEASRYRIGQTDTIIRIDDLDGHIGLGRGCTFSPSDLELVKSTEETITPETQGDVMSEEKKEIKFAIHRSEMTRKQRKQLLAACAAKKIYKQPTFDLNRYHPVIGVNADAVDMGIDTFSSIVPGTVKYVSFSEAMAVLDADIPAPETGKKIREKKSTWERRAAGFLVKKVAWPIVVRPALSMASIAALMGAGFMAVTGQWELMPKAITEVRSWF